MIEVRFHGRGGQGAVTAARLLADAAFLEGKYSQAFPFFGAERRGAPVLAFTRINKKPIRSRSQIYEPNHVVVLDPLLPQVVNVSAGIKKNGIIVINSKNPPQLEGAKVAFVDATSIAMETIGAAITNTAMIGALAQATKIVSLDSAVEAVKKRFKGEAAEKNAAAVIKAYEQTVIG
ncbi:MAG: pyruvate ferredoxin oxidoreductase subunit gamma [Candidatus Hadarchaeota archaeon]